MPARDIGGPSLDAETYTVKRNLLRQEYWVEDPDRTRVLATERTVSGGRATYEFRDVSGGGVGGGNADESGNVDDERDTDDRDADDVVFSVHSQNAFDAAGDFVLAASEGGNTDENRTTTETSADEHSIVLSKHLGFRQHRWTVARPDGTELAEVTSRRRIVGALNTVSEMLSPFPQKFTVTTPNGERIGEISGRFALRTVFDVRIDRPGATPRATLVAAAIAIAVLESG